MTEEELTAIEARGAAATPGPWRVSGLPYDETDDPCVLTADGTYICQTVYDMQSQTQEHAIEADTRFIAAAREDVPRLCDEVRRLRAVLGIYADQRTWCDARWTWGWDRDGDPWEPAERALRGEETP